MPVLKIATEDKLHSAESAAMLLAIRPSNIRSWWAIGKLKRVKIGRLSRAYESDILALVTTEGKDKHAK